jgi:hypothetical protein
VFISQFCNVAEVVIISKTNEENNESTKQRKKGHPFILFANGK